jgi:mannosyltransferase
MALHTHTRLTGTTRGADSARENRFRLVVALVSSASALVSLTGSWIPSLWGDEAASIMSATRSLPSLFTMLGSVDAVHGAYYLGLHFWVELFGASPLSVRLPSALTVGATVAAVMLVCRRLGGIRIAVAAGVICAVIPRVSYMGSEARSSAVATAFVAWLTVVLLELLRRGTPTARWWIGYSALLAVGTYVFLYVILLAVAHAVILLSARAGRDFVKRWTACVVVAVLAASPVVFLAVNERRQVAFLAHRDVITLPKLAVSLWFGQPIFAAVAWALLACAAAAVFVGWRRRVSRDDDRGFGMPRLETVAAAWLLVPSVILIGGFSIVPVYTARYLSFCAPAAAILMAVGLDWAARGRARSMAAALVVVIACAAPVWLSQRQPHAKNNSDFAQTSAIIDAHASAGDAVAFDESVRPSLRPRLAMRLYPEAFAGLRDITLHVRYDAGASWHDTAYDLHDAAAQGRLRGVTRVWFIEYSARSAHNAADEAALEHLGFIRAAEYAAHRSVVYEYVLPRR